MYDIAKGRPSKIDVEWDPFQRLDTPFRARRATRLGAAAGWVICGDYLLCAWIMSGRVPKFHALVSSDPATLAAIQVALAAVAGCLALLMLKRPSVWAAAILLAWAACQVIRPISVLLVGQATPMILAVLMVTLALLGFRGALALRKLAATNTGQPDGPGVGGTAAAS